MVLVEWGLAEVATMFAARLAEAPYVYHLSEACRACMSRCLAAELPFVRAVGPLPPAFVARCMAKSTGHSCAFSGGEVAWMVAQLPLGTRCADLQDAHLQTAVRGMFARMAGGDALPECVVRSVATQLKGGRPVSVFADVAGFMRVVATLDPGVWAIGGGAGAARAASLFFKAHVPGDVVVADMHPGVWRLVQEAFADPVRLTLVNWADLKRAPMSCVGPAIADVRVREVLPGGRLGTCNAMLQLDNFRDVTAMWPVHKFRVQVGNVVGRPSRNLALAELLAPEGAPDVGNCVIPGPLFADASETLMVSALSAIVNPTTSDSFVLTIDPYGNPAPTLVVLATTMGTSCVVVPPHSRGTTLVMHNNRGTGTALRATRTAESVAPPGAASTVTGHVATAPPSAMHDPAHTVIMFQIPLAAAPASAPAPAPASAGLAAKGIVSRGCGAAAMRTNDVFTAVVGEGLWMGPFPDLKGQVLRRGQGQARATVILVNQGTSPSLDKVETMYLESRTVYMALNRQDGPLSKGSLVTGEGDNMHKYHHDAAAAAGAAAGAGAGAGASVPTAPAPLFLFPF